MKYKNIGAAIHNYGHSFISYNNYLDGGFIIDELRKIHELGIDIEIDILNLNFRPKEISSRVRTSASHYKSDIGRFFASMNVDATKIRQLKIIWNKEDNILIEAIDDRNIKYMKYINMK